MQQLVLGRTTPLIGAFSGERPVMWRVQPDELSVTLAHDGAEYAIALKRNGLGNGKYTFAAVCPACGVGTRKLVLVDGAPTFTCSGCAGVKYQRIEFNRAALVNAGRKLARARRRCAPIPPSGRTTPYWLTRCAALVEAETELLTLLGIYRGQPDSN